jgi:hypothetical protein
MSESLVGATLATTRQNAGSVLNRLGAAGAPIMARYRLRCHD